MAWNEKPPMLTGKAEKDVAAIRDYLFRMSTALASMSMMLDALAAEKDGKSTLKQGNK